MNIQNSVAHLQQVYRDSPTAQVIVDNAPAIISGFRELQAQRMDLQAQIQALIVQREYDLRNFETVAPKMLENLHNICNEIFSLQAEVRRLANCVDSNPQLKTVIDYTNSQISQNIKMFNQLSFNLLNA